MNSTDKPFPDARLADAKGLVAVGGDLSMERLLEAYRKGIFPWTVNPVSWWSPEPRGIFEMDGLRVSRSISKIMRQGVFKVTKDRAFALVIAACAERRRGEHGTWISAEFMAAYTRLHELGHAHSVECWQDGQLVGGIYGVSVGGLFAGESMFHRVSNASKVALVCLAEHLRERGYVLFDIQMVTPITRQFGAIAISRNEYLQRLKFAVAQDCEWN